LLTTETKTLKKKKNKKKSKTTTNPPPKKKQQQQQQQTKKQTRPDGSITTGNISALVAKIADVSVKNRCDFITILPPLCLYRKKVSRILSNRLLNMKQGVKEKS